ncbi:MAG TPA: polymer-forming cytoskeletal protein [Longimicrobiales bacterium]|nr:polymer-forming cytoskeletal protein [Longimicrobiales bacterium]
MWKKEEEQAVRPTQAPAPSPEPVRAPAVRSGPATIGPSIVIHGEVSGSEDLLIQGQIDGSVSLGAHSVTVGGGGRVNADISGRVITIEGDVEGDLTAQEQIVLRGSAKVLGDIKAPRVVLEDGASFRGLVDMGTAREREKPGAASKASQGGPAPSGAQGKEGKASGSGPSVPGREGGREVGTPAGSGSSGGGSAVVGRESAERRTGS